MKENAWVRSRFVTLMRSSLVALLLLFGLGILSLPFFMITQSTGLRGAYLLYLLYPFFSYLILKSIHQQIHKRPAWPPGFSWHTMVGPLLLGLIMGMLLPAVSMITAAALHPNITFMPIQSPPADLAWSTLITTAYITAILEEFVFRGYLLLAFLDAGWQLRTAISWNVFLFVLAHMMIPEWWLAIGPLTVSGLLFVLLYFTSGSIWASVGFHFAGNVTFGAISQELLLASPGMANHLGTLALAQLLVYSPAVLLLLMWQQRRGIGGSHFDSRAQR